MPSRTVEAFVRSSCDNRELLYDECCVCRIRWKKKENSYALSLSYHHDTKHYKIDQRKTASEGIKFAIERGPTFDNLMDVRRMNDKSYHSH